MNDLYRFLADMDSTARGGLEQIWHVHSETSDPLKQAQAIGDAMCSATALQEIVSQLSKQTRDMLSRIAHNGGSMPLHQLQSFGNIRKLGSAKMLREQPWLFPQNPVEDLVYKGLCFAVYQQTQTRLVEQLVIPNQLLTALQSALPAVTSQSIEAPKPQKVTSCSRTFAEDIMALLVSIRQHMPHAANRRGIAAAIDAELDRLSVRLLGPSDINRLTLVRNLILALSLVRPEHGRLMPAPNARQWLRQSDPDLNRSLLSAWQELPGWRELELISDLDLDRTALQHDPRPARRAVLTSLMALPVSQWQSTEGFVHRLKLEHPDLLRPNGDMQSWHIHDAESGELLAGFAHWERIEGEMIQATLQWPLCWLGVVDIGDQGACFRIRPNAREQIAGQKLGQPRQSPKPANVDNSFYVHIPTASTLYDRYQLERFAQWESQTQNTATLRITAESVWEGQNADVPVERILGFLDRITVSQVPQIVRQTLEAWGGRFGRVMVRRVILLETDERATMQTLQEWPKISLLLEKIISPTVCLVREENLEELTKRLKQKGIWPHISIGPT